MMEINLNFNLLILRFIGNGEAAPSLKRAFNEEFKQLNMGAVRKPL